MPDKPKKYKIVISKDALSDIKSTKKYILDTFKYREYAVLIIEISKGGNILATENQQVIINDVVDVKQACICTKLKQIQLKTTKNMPDLIEK